MENTDPNRHQQIQSSLAAIVESSDRWLVRLQRRERRVRLASSFLTASLLFLLVGVISLVFQIVQGHLYEYFQQPNPTMTNPPSKLVIAFAIAGGSALIAALVSGFATYFLLKRKHDSRLKSLSSMVTEMKNKIDAATKANGQGITENALSTADRIMALLPQLIRNRKQDSLLFGAVAFVIAGVIAKNPVVAIIAGVLVWLYFRYWTKRIYDQEISKFEEQKRVFEQQKHDFLDSL